MAATSLLWTFNDIASKAVNHDLSGCGLQAYVGQPKSVKTPLEMRRKSLTSNNRGHSLQASQNTPVGQEFQHNLHGM